MFLNGQKPSNHLLCGHLYLDHRPAVFWPLRMGVGIKTNAFSCPLGFAQKYLPYKYLFILSVLLTAILKPPMQLKQFYLSLGFVEGDEEGGSKKYCNDELGNTKKSPIVTIYTMLEPWFV